MLRLAVAFLSWYCFQIESPPRLQLSIIQEYLVNLEFTY